ncbi:MAG: toxin-antitoxin system YwqK family antitoxin [Chitinophagaceae bacterium]
MRTLISIAILALFSISSQAQQLNQQAVSSGEHVTLANTEKPEDRFFFTKDGIISESLNERKLYSGHVKRKKLDGNWESWYQNGQLCDSGTLVSGLPDGEWKYWNEQGQLLALRTYSADKYKRIQMELSRYTPKRTAYPLTVMYHKDRSAATKYLHSSYSFPHTIKRIDDQTLQQWVTANITPGNSYHPVFDQSLHHGLFMNFFPDGQVKDSGYYQNGLRQGVWIHRAPPGSTSQMGAYKNGYRIKEWRIYTHSGKLAGMIFYNNKGEEYSRKNFDN